MKNYSSEDSTYIEVLDDKYGYNRSAFRMGISDDPHTKYGEPVFVRAFNLDKQYLKEILLTLGIFVISIIWYYIVLKGAEYLPKKKIGGTGPSDSPTVAGRRGKAICNSLFPRPLG
jgi:hypothetical protein